MKKLIRTSVSVIFIAAFAAVSGQLFSSMSSGEETFIKTDSASFIRSDGIAAAPSDAICVMSPSESAYIIREYRGKVGIFSSSDTESPMLTLDVYVFTLPSVVSERLKNGIRCSSDELYCYIDAFTS